MQMHDSTFSNACIWHLHAVTIHNSDRNNFINDSPFILVHKVQDQKANIFHTDIIYRLFVTQQW